MKCVKCGQEIPDNSQFCGYCGTKVESKLSTKRFCASCGKELKPNAKFCTSCGAVVSQNQGREPQNLKTKSNISSNVVSFGIFSKQILLGSVIFYVLDLIGIISLVICFISLFLTYASNWVASISFISRPDGMIALIVIFITLIFAIFRIRIGAMIGSILILIIQIVESIDFVEKGEGYISMSIGFYLLLFGAVLALICFLLAYIEQRKARGKYNVLS